MKCVDRALGAGLLLALLAGCNAASTVGPLAADDQSPEGAVAKFLDAVRTGDQDKANAMLTVVARTKTAEKDLVVAPPGSDSASFKVGQVESVGEGVAHVETFWTDKDDDNNPHTDAIVWFVRKDPEGWRISGMATRVYDGQIPVVLNFEDPEDMLRRQQAVEKEMASRMKAEQAAKPQVTPR